MDDKLHERMLARGVAESMLRAGGKLPARPVCMSVWATIATVAATVMVVGLIAASFGVGQ